MDLTDGALSETDGTLVFKRNPGDIQGYYF